MKVLCYSSFTFSYLNRARVLYTTLRRFHPDWELVALITDEPPEGFVFDPDLEPFDRVVWAQDLGIENFRNWLFRHDVVEVCTAVKGPFIHQACAQADIAIYLDPDTALLAPLDPLIEMLGEHQILLTPHLIDPNTERTAILDNDLSASRTGIFNLGFVAIRTTGEGARFARWWNDRLLEYCYDDMPKGLFVDQRWCDHVPALFDGVKVVRDPGYNVASWNLSQRKVAIGKDGAITVNGQPLRFWHFTKLGPTGDLMTKKYAGDNFEVYEIWNWYKRQVAQATDPAIPERYWAYGAYADGTPIDKAHRVQWRESPDLQAHFDDPFKAGPGSYLEWLRAQAPSATARPKSAGLRLAETAAHRLVAFCRRLAGYARRRHHRLFKPIDRGLLQLGAPGSAAYELVSGSFDHRFYLSENPDVAASGMDPVAHFLDQGWREGRDPAPWFSVSDYLEFNPDVAAAAIHPFVHYLQAGRQEGRLARLELGFRHRVIAALQPIEARLAAAEAHDDFAEPGGPKALADLLAVTRSGLADLHLTFSHDDYSTNLGGVQLCLQREAAAAEATGRDHLHLYPLNSRPLLRSPGHAEPLGVVWNGVPVGVFSLATLVDGLEAGLAKVAPGRRSLAIHSLLGHSVSDVLAIARAVGLDHGWFWVHDFASVCASYHLLRNDVADCGAPPLGSAACGVCVYGEHRQFHLDEHERLFRALEISVAAPSQAALDTWRRGAGLPAVKTLVAPLARLSPRRAEAIEPPAAAPAERPFRFAFPGLPSGLKGWSVFRDLVLRFAEDPRYEFLHLARDPASGLPLSFHPVTVSQANPRAMQAMLETLDVDAVMIWSLCRETFSFTTHEAAAAGAAILTGPDSGNVAAFVQATGLGEVIVDETALFELFESGEVLRFSRRQRAPAPADLTFSRLTIDLLDGEAA